MKQNNRGQTVLDFAIAMGIFLLALAFVFTFIPSLTAPFVDGTQEQPSVSDRVASHLVEGGLADPNQPYVLDVECTRALFDEDTEEPLDEDVSISDGCDVNYDGDSTAEQVGVSDRLDVQLELARGDGSGDTETLYYENDEIVTDSGEIELIVGDDPTGDGSTTVARRVVSIDGMDAVLFVRVS